MKITYKGKLQQIKLAVEDANDFLNSGTFYSEIAEFSGFKCTNLSPLKISSILEKTSLEVEVKLYKPKWPFSDVLGYFEGSYPNNIFLNARKIYRETNSITNTIIHEYVHAVDYEFDNKILDFGHDCSDIIDSAPYQIGNIAEKIINGSNQTKNLGEEFTIKILPNRILNL